MIELKIKSGESIFLTPILIEDDIYELIDQDSVSHLTLKWSEKDLKVEDRKDTIEKQDSLGVKLSNLHKELSRDNGTEDENEDATESDPFNPEEISIETKIITLETCIRRLEQGTIILNPDF